MILFKTLNGNQSVYAGCTWSLPHNGHPGDWMPRVEGKLVECQTGYHLSREDDLIHWLARDIYAAEYRGEMIECDDKVVVREARLIKHYDTWNERTQRWFACDCAERVACLGGEATLRATIETARRYAEGQATDEELAAAWTAADAIAEAAGAATWAATWAAEAAARAARAPARAAADAARVAEREWQTTRLLQCLGGNDER